jgi:FkbM family methyltransferase
MKKLLKKITPPLLLTVAQNLRIKLLPTPKFAEPSVNVIRGGILKGKKIFCLSKGFWQDEMINGSYDQYFFDYLKNLDLKDKTILDIGAHIGYLSMGFSRLVGTTGQVYAFEPNPFNIERLNNHLELNKEINNIKIINYALSNKDGEEEFMFSPKIEKGASSGSFLNSAHTFWDKDIYEKKAGFKRMIVRTKTLDQLYDAGELTKKPDLLKIDIEGAEFLMLEGAKNTIEKYKPTILIEIHSIYNMLVIGKMMRDWNYKIELLKEERDGRCFLAMTPNSHE